MIIFNVLEYDWKDLEVIVSILSDALLIIFGFFGAIWAYHTFYTNENKAGLSIYYKQLSHYKIKKNKYFLNILINIKNVSNRELNLVLDQTYIKVFRKSKNGLKLIGSFKGRDSENLNIENARIRSGVDYNFPYLIDLHKQGKYFIEFSVKTDMDKYKSTPSILLSKIRRLSNKILRVIVKLIFWKKIKIVDRDTKFIRWYEKIYYVIE
ncbi:hypothetical protein ACU8DI_04880 [Psychroserpens sp. BH13MA-6]